jgi:hypothetical protein
MNIITHLGGFDGSGQTADASADDENAFMS